jgi:hypothetical protein
MQLSKKAITLCLWFDTRAEEFDLAALQRAYAGKAA